MYQICYCFAIGNNAVTFIYFTCFFFSVLVYLVLYRLDELGIGHFRKFVVSHETNKMHRVRVKLLLFYFSKNQDLSLSILFVIDPYIDPVYTFIAKLLRKSLDEATIY